MLKKSQEIAQTFIKNYELSDSDNEDFYCDFIHPIFIGWLKLNCGHGVEVQDERDGGFWFLFNGFGVGLNFMMVDI